MDDFPPEFRCRCRRWPEECQAKATQEDMRCDGCREGCSLIGIHPPGDVPDSWMHVKVSEWKMTYAPSR